MLNNPASKAHLLHQFCEKMHGKIGFFPVDACKKAVHMNGTYCKQELALSRIPGPVGKLAH